MTTSRNVIRCTTSLILDKRRGSGEVSTEAHNGMPHCNGLRAMTSARPTISYQSVELLNVFVRYSVSETLIQVLMKEGIVKTDTTVLQQCVISF